MKKPENCIVVIFGAGGDLTKRMLVPALFDLFYHDFLPDQWAILGVGYSAFSDESFRGHLLENIELSLEEKPVERQVLEEFSKNLFFERLDRSSPEDYSKLKGRLRSLDRQFMTGGNCIYYLATPPQAFEPIAANLNRYGMHQEGEGSGWKKIIVEKPFGHDLFSARALNKRLLELFREDQIYRIDHYLGKDTVQNILALRFANGIFEPLWNRNYVDHIEITAAEQIGIEHRGKYYDASGALRDMVQNHLLQLVGFIAMEPPSSFHADAIRNEKVKVFQSLRPLRPENVEHCVVRGQYIGSVQHDRKAPGYRQETDVAPDSRTETYVAMKFYVDNWRWGGIPFYVRTGKRLPTRVTEAVIHFKKTPHYFFAGRQKEEEVSNQLVIRIQPDEGILLRFGMKVPGTTFTIRNVHLNFHYADLSEEHLPLAYENLLLDCMQGDASLFSRSDAVESCWEFVMPILEAWKDNPEIMLYEYPAGTWGPDAACNLFDDPRVAWRYPCRNLTEEGGYCEL